MESSLTNLRRTLFLCTVCAAKFTKSGNLSRHMKNKHDISIRDQKASLKCPLCETKRTSYKELEAHLTSEHDLDITHTKLNFASKELFEHWKIDIEKETLSFFRSRKTKGNFVQYGCHRSGSFVAKPNTPIRQRSIKAIGSNKIGACCPARIEIIKKGDGGIEVLFVSTHVGHKQEVGRLRLTKVEKECIAEKLLRGVPNQRILKDLRESFDPNLKISYTTTNDLHNLKKAFHVKADVIFHSDDAKSVDILNRKYRDSSENPILAYEPYGKADEDLEENDFFFTFMNAGQEEMYDNVIMIDSTLDNNDKHEFMSDQLRLKLQDQTLEEAKELLKNNLAKLYDVIESCSSEAITFANKVLPTLLSSMNALTPSRTEVMENAEKDQTSDPSSSNN